MDAEIGWGGERVPVRPGDTVGRSATARLRSYHPATGELHALFTVREGRFVLRGLGRSLEVDGPDGPAAVTEVALSPGLEVRFPGGERLVVHGVSVGAPIWALSDGVDVEPLTSGRWACRWAPRLRLHPWDRKREDGDLVVFDDEDGGWWLWDGAVTRAVSADVPLDVGRPLRLQAWAGVPPTIVGAMSGFVLREIGDGVVAVQWAGASPLPVGGRIGALLLGLREGPRYFGPLADAVGLGAHPDPSQAVRNVHAELTKALRRHGLPGDLVVSFGGGYRRLADRARWVPDRG